MNALPGSSIVQVPLEIRIRPHLLYSFSANFSGEHWAKTVPPAPNRFVANNDAALMQQVFDGSERKWKPNVLHDRQANDLWAAMKALERITFCHLGMLANRPSRYKEFALAELQCLFISVQK